MLFVGSVVTSGINVFPKPADPGLGHLGLYITRAEERAWIRIVLFEPGFDNRGSGIFGYRDSTQNQNVEEVVKDLARKLTFSDLQRHTRGIKHREHFFNMLNVAFKLDENISASLRYTKNVFNRTAERMKYRLR